MLATADALSVSIEIINSNQRQFGTRLVTPSNSHPTSQIVLGHIEQLHYVGTRPSLPLESTNSGGYAEGFTMRNTCSLDGPLFWLMLTIYKSPNLFQFMVDNEMQDMLSVYEKFKKGYINDGKLEWYKEIAGQNIYRHNDYVDFSGSESTNFFRTISTTPLAGVSFHRSCISCHHSDNFSKLVRVKRTMNVPLKEIIEKSFSDSQENCPSCRKKSILKVTSLPPLLVFSGDYLFKDDTMPVMVAIKALEKIIVFMLVLITVQDLETNRFTNFFRLDTPEWFFFDSSKKPTLSFKGVLEKLKAEKITYFAYIQSDYLNKSVWPDGFIQLDLLISSFSSDDDDDSPKTNIKNDNQTETPFIKVDLNAFKEYLKENVVQLKELFINVKVVPTNQLRIGDIDDQTKYDGMYEEEKEELRKISTRSKVLKEVPLTIKAQRFSKVFQRIMDDFLNKL